MTLVAALTFSQVVGAAEPPNWWAGALDASKASQDYAVATQGQAMHMAQKAYERLRAEFTPAVVDALEQAQPAGNRIGPVLSAYQAAGNSKVLSLGQLKRVSAPFWLHLQSLEVLGVPPAPVSPFPWTPQTSDDADSSPATLGQVKMAFSFPLDAGLVDSDQDRLPDWWEARWARPGAVELNGSENSPGPGISRDADGDGLGDYEEFLRNSNPRTADTDGDGIGDGVESNIGTEVLMDSRGVDSDGDGITDAAEGLLKYLAETRISNAYPGSTAPASLSVLRNISAHGAADVNANGLPDDWEAIWGMGEDGDPDQDGLYNRQEVLHRTWPRRLLHHLAAADRTALLADLNGNGIPELFEEAYDFAPSDYDDALSLMENSPAAADFDADSGNDGIEVRRGTDPRIYTAAPSAGGGQSAGAAPPAQAALPGSVPPYDIFAEGAFSDAVFRASPGIFAYRGKVLSAPDSPDSPPRLKHRLRYVSTGDAESHAPPWTPWVNADFWSSAGQVLSDVSYRHTNQITGYGLHKSGASYSLLDLAGDGDLPVLTFLRLAERSVQREAFADNDRSVQTETQFMWDRIETGPFQGLGALGAVPAGMPRLIPSDGYEPYDGGALTNGAYTQLFFIQIGSHAGKSLAGMRREQSEGIPAGESPVAMFCRFAPGKDIGPPPHALSNYVKIKLRVTGNVQLLKSGSGEEILEEGVWHNAAGAPDAPLEFPFRARLKSSTGTVAFDLQYYRWRKTSENAEWEYRLQELHGSSVRLYSYNAQPARSGPRINVRSSDHTGSRFRKIGLDGLPMADSKPQGEGETDQPYGDVHIDALTHSLQLRTSDLAVPVASSDLVISADRTLNQEISSDNDLQNYPDVGNIEGGYIGKPFGVCWSTGLSPHVVLEVMGSDLSHEPDRASVVDESGGSHQFALGWLGGTLTSPQQPVFIPLSSGPDQTAFMNRLEIGGASSSNPSEWSLTLHKRFGTKTRYQYLGSLIDTRVTPEGKTEVRRTRHFFRIRPQQDNQPAGDNWAVQDRYGRNLYYTFSDPTGNVSPSRMGEFLIPSKISDFPKGQEIRWMTITKGTSSTIPGVLQPERFIQEISLFGTPENDTAEPGRLLQSVKYGYTREPVHGSAGTRYPLLAQLVQLKTISRLLEDAGQGQPPRYLTTTYGYGSAQEGDAGPVLPGQPATVYRYCWLDSIQQPDGRYVRFETAYDRSRVFYSQTAGTGTAAALYYQQGRPRPVSAVHAGLLAPGQAMETAADELTLSRFQLQSDGARVFPPTVLESSDNGIQIKNEPVNAVIDGDSRLRVYRFRDPSLREAKTLRDVLFRPAPEGGGKDILVEVAWKTMEIDHTLGAREIYRFEPEAMMALKSSKMILPGAGNGPDREVETTWEYSSPFLITHAIPLFEGSPLVSHPFFVKYYPDATAEVRVVHQDPGIPAVPGAVKEGDVIRREFKYWADHDSSGGTAKFRQPWARTMTGSSLLLNGTRLRATATSLDAQGRVQDIKETAGGTAVLREKKFYYESPAFPSFVTREVTTEGVGTGQDLVKTSHPDKFGNPLVVITGHSTEFTRNLTVRNALGQTTATRTGGNGISLDAGDTEFLTGYFYRRDGKISRMELPEPGVGTTFPGSNQKAVTTYEYQNGRLTGKTAADGSLTLYYYDSLGRVEKLEQKPGTAADGRYLTSDGEQVTYTTETFRTSSGLIYKEIGANGLVTETIYDWLRRPSAVITLDNGSGADPRSPNRTMVRMEYSGSWCGDSLFSGSGFKPTAVYGPLVTSAGVPVRSESRYNSLGWKTSELVQYSLDGLMAESRTFLNAEGRPVQIWTAPTADYPEGRKACTIYDQLGRVKETASPDGLITKTLYSTADLPIQVSMEIPAVGSLFGFQKRISLKVYDSAGREKTVYNADPAADGVLAQAAREIRYDSAGRVIRTAVPMGVDGTSSSLVTITEYDRRGRVVKVSQGKGTIDSATAAGLDLKDYGNLLGGGEPSTANKIVTETKYDDLDRPAWIKAPDGSVSLTVYDFAGRVIRTVSPAGMVYEENQENGLNSYGQFPLEGGERRLVTASTYDAAGKVTLALSGITLSVASSTEDHTAWTSAVADISVNPPFARGLAVRNSWDAHGRLTGTTRSGKDLDASEYFTYDLAGNRLSVRDANGKTTRFTYDPLGRVLTTRYDHPDGAPQADLEIATNVYDAFNLTRSTAPDGRYKLYKYDEGNRLSRVECFAAANTPGDATQEQKWSAAGELLSVSFLSAGQDLSWRDTVYTYDRRGRRTSERSAGKLHTYSYDVRDRLTEVVTDETGADDNEDDDDVAIATAYDPLGRVSSITETRGNPAIQAITRYGYDLASRQIVKELPANSQAALSEWRFLDKAGRPLFQETRRKMAGGSGFLSRISPKWDPHGNLIEQEEIKPHEGGLPSTVRIVRNLYDGLNRLIREDFRLPPSAVRAKVNAYSYDAGGNRTLKSTTFNEDHLNTIHLTYGHHGSQIPPSVPAVAAEPHETTRGKANQMESVHDSSTNEIVVFRYDKNGNRARMIRLGPPPPPVADDSQRPVLEITSYQWDQSNRLTEIIVKDGSETVTGTWKFAYDHRSRRILRQAPGMTDVEMDSYAGGTALTRWRASQASTPPAGRTRLATFIRGSDLGGGVGGLLYTLASDVVQKHFVEYGSRGDVIGEINNAGQVTFRTSYEAFGDHTDYGSTTPALRHRASTKEEESALGLLNEGFRWRDIRTGAFLSRDPAGFIDGPNLYAYVSQNPWSKFDPHGLWELSDVIDIARDGAAGFWEGTGGAIMDQGGQAMAEAIAVREEGGGILTTAGAFAGRISGATNIAEAAYGYSLDYDADSGSLGTHQMSTGERWVKGVTGTVGTVTTGLTLAKPNLQLIKGTGTADDAVVTSSKTVVKKSAVVGGATTTSSTGAGLPPVKFNPAAKSAEIIAPSVDEIVRANQAFASGRTLTGEVDTVLANMAYREGLYDKTATAIRDIAGRHLFQDGNKRTAQAIAEQMMKANGGAATPAQIRSVIDQVGQGGLKSVEEISAALRGAK